MMNVIAPPVKRLRRSRVLMLGIQTSLISEPLIDIYPASGFNSESDVPARFTIDMMSQQDRDSSLNRDNHKAPIRHEGRHCKENKVEHDIRILAADQVGPAAKSMMMARPVAAKGVSHGRIPVKAGRITPIPPRISQMPIKMRNPRGTLFTHFIRDFICSNRKAWLYPATTKANPSKICKTHKMVFILISFQFLPFQEQLLQTLQM
jgi:hypothetical protein